MQARRLSASRGWFWIVEGFRLYRRNPALLTFLVFGYLLLLVVVNLVPLIGFMAAQVCVPALSVGVMNGCRAIGRGKPAPFGVLLSGFRRHPNTLLTLGVFYLAGWLAALAASALVDDGLLMQIMLAGRRPPAEALESTELLLAMQTALAVMMPITMVFWFAPPLAAWENHSAAKSLFFSLVACWRNWRAFLVYGGAVGLISVLLPGAVLAFTGEISESMSRLLAVALFAVLGPTLYASIYVSYCDVFVGTDAV